MKSVIGKNTARFLSLFALILLCKIVSADSPLALQDPISSLALFPALGFVLGHCDTLEGPVVAAAKEALDKGDVKLVLIWVQKDDEEEITRAFNQTLVVRKLSPEARAMADMYFYETLVRIHRAGEGAPYTGLKSGEEVEPGIAAADEAVKSGAIEPLHSKLDDEMKVGIHSRFEKLMKSKNYDKGDVEAGREFVRNYVVFIHYVEAIFLAIEGGNSEHGEAKGGEHGH